VRALFAENSVLQVRNNGF